MSELSVPLRPAHLKGGHPCPPCPSFPLCLFIFLVPPHFCLPLSPQLCHQLLPANPLPPPNLGWFEGWCADLVIQIRVTSSVLLFLLCLRVPDLSFSCHPRPAATEDLLKQHSFSSTSVNSNAVTQISVREERSRVSSVPRSKDCAFFGPSFGDMFAVANTFLFFTLNYNFVFLTTASKHNVAAVVMKRRKEQYTSLWEVFL